MSGTLYVGVTGQLAARVMQHRNDTGSAFCREHGLTRLVYVERHATMLDAIARERALKNWSWELNLIGRANPDWRDLRDVMNM